MHPGIKTIAVAPVVNQTTSYNSAADLRGLLSSQFMVDGSLELVDLKTADCIIYAEIKDMQFSEIADSSYDKDVIFRATEWRVTVTIGFTVIVPGRKEPLIESRDVTGDAIFQVQADMETNRRRGVQQACYEAAKVIVEYTTESW